MKKMLMVLVLFCSLPAFAVQKNLTKGLQAGNQSVQKYFNAQYAHNLIAQEAKNQQAEADLQRRQSLLANLKASFAEQQARYQSILDNPSTPREIKLAAMEKLGNLEIMNAGLSIANVDNLSSSQDVDVDGYYRSNGTYVNPHYRSAPNNTTLDNYSTKGNYNPYTGAAGTRDPYSNSGFNYSYR
jgi:hypothetical protein